MVCRNEAWTCLRRIDNALRGNSHNARVGGAMLTVRSRRQPHPHLVLVNEAGSIATDEGASLASHAVIVENLENFLDLDGTLELFPGCGLGVEWQDADILFGSGNGITNYLFTAVFQQYQEIGCLFDPDPGGVQCRSPFTGSGRNCPVSRDIANFSARGNLVLADAGKAFFSDLFCE